MYKNRILCEVIILKCVFIANKVCTLLITVIVTSKVAAETETTQNRIQNNTELHHSPLEEHHWLLLFTLFICTPMLSLQVFL